MVLRFLYESGPFRTLGTDLFEIGRKFDINNIQNVGQSLVHDGLAKFTSGSTIQITVEGMDVVESMMSTGELVEANIKNRQKLLNFMYERHLTDNPNVLKNELIKQLGLDEDSVDDILHYYHYKQFIMRIGLGGPLQITYDGISEVDRYRGIREIN
jgi:hypothetical protein